LSPVGRRIFGVALALATGLTGWLTSPFLITAALGAAWLPEVPSIPAVAILDGLVVAIDPGHGGYDPGVLLEGREGKVRECDLNLAICLSLRDILARAGAKVILTRTADVDLTRPGDETLYGSVARGDLCRRAQVAMAGGPDLFISVHCNAFPQSQYRGSQCFYLEDGSPASRRLAEAIQGELVRVTGETDRMANRRQGIFLLKEVPVPAATVELGFLSNPRDLELLTNPDYQKLCAMAIFFGICRFALPEPSPAG